MFRITRWKSYLLVLLCAVQSKILSSCLILLFKHNSRLAGNVWDFYKRHLETLLSSSSFPARDPKENSDSLVTSSETNSGDRKSSHFNVNNHWNVLHRTARPDCKLSYAILTTCCFIKVCMSVSNETCKPIIQSSKLELTKTEEPPSFLALIFCLSLFVSFTRM